MGGFFAQGGPFLRAWRSPGAAPRAPLPTPTRATAASVSPSRSSTEAQRATSEPTPRARPRPTRAPAPATPERVDRATEDRREASSSIPAAPTASRSQQPAWTFAGTSALRRRGITGATGVDAVGAYHEITFAFTDTSAKTAGVRAYDQLPVAILTETYVAAATNDAAPFPTFTSYPQVPHHVTYSDTEFSPVSFDTLTSDSPFVFFDDAAEHVHPLGGVRLHERGDRRVDERRALERDRPGGADAARRVLPSDGARRAARDQRGVRDVGRRAHESLRQDARGERRHAVSRALRLLDRQRRLLLLQLRHLDRVPGHAAAR